MPQFIFNQIATYYNTQRLDRFGKLELDSGIDKQCRYAIKAGTYKDSRGQDIENTVGLHTYYDPDIKIGSVFKLSNNLYYVVESRTHTSDRNGKFVKTYCILKQKPV